MKRKGSISGSVSAKEILKEEEKRIKVMVKGLWGSIMRKERAMYIEEHPTKANGYSAWDLLALVGPREDLRVPCVREGEFYPKILPYWHRTSLEHSKAILALYAAGVSTRASSRFLEGIYGAFDSLQSISPLTKAVDGEVRAWRERPLDEEYYAVFLNGTSLSVCRGQSAKEPVYIALGIKPDGRRKILGFWLSGAEGGTPRTGRTCSRTFGRGAWKG